MSLGRALAFGGRPTAGRFLKDRRGSILIEMAFAVPILLILTLGCFDTARYILLHQKLDRAASTMADLVSRPTGISATQIDSMFSAASELVQPFTLSTDGHVIVTSMSRVAGDVARIDWQHTGGGSLTATSSIGSTAGAVASLPTGFTVSEGENVIVAEVFFDFEPMFLDQILDPGVITHLAVRKPRRGDLSTLN